ncbi:DegQ family serine endoprotease [Rhizobium sp. DKSPLA3]|uniref:Probable periplasmic serine endoprotease DegP-like n=1 Tax=Rhizobium quercicola TaxID=2901226 RepID=A0A9X1NVQ5_9HYPH|nr:DegQ family serine endoprotease [Rhizobium quercicola]MCD7110806.1 DegQ family serine endoprotease [Rhizobium quercicola]
MGSHRSSFTRTAALALSTALVFAGPLEAMAQVAKPIAPPTATGPLPVPPQPSPSIPPQARAAQGPDSVADLAAGLLDAVVNISTSQNVKTDDDTPMPKVPQGSPFQDFFDEFFKGQNGQGAPGRKVESLGSGFVIDPTGYIVTNNHVIEGADDIEVNFANGSKLKAKLIGTDTKTDLAVLKVEPKKPLTAVPLGDSRTMRIGDWVMAIGNPFGLGGTVTVGIISARGRNINAGPYDNFIQTDAAINRGNSGGPLFNMKGEVIGINTAIISPSGGSIGIGFSVPTELASNVITQLKDFGETRRGWLGVRIQPVTDDIAESLGMDTPRGALVAGIIEGGPISKGEIKTGDVITKFDGRDVAEMRDLPRVVAESPVGKAVDVIVIRDGKEMTVQVTLGRLEDADVANAEASTEDAPGSSDDAPATEGEGGAGSPEGTDQAEPPAAELPKFDEVLGMKLALLETPNRRSFGIGDDVEGVVITEVAQGSAAAERRITAGDVIVEIGQEAMKTPEDVTARIEELKADGRRNALLMISNKTGELRFVTVRIE